MRATGDAVNESKRYANEERLWHVLYEVGGMVPEFEECAAWYEAWHRSEGREPPTTVKDFRFVATLALELHVVRASRARQRRFNGPSVRAFPDIREYLLLEFDDMPDDERVWVRTFNATVERLWQEEQSLHPERAPAQWTDAHIRAVMNRAFTMTHALVPTWSRRTRNHRRTR